MMAHNLFRNYETEGNQEAADRAKRHRNECNRRYHQTKKEFDRMIKEQRRIDQIIADNEETWDMVKKLKQT